MLILLAVLLQSGDLPVPPDYEERLKRQGYVEESLPSNEAEIAADDWVLWRRDRNYEVLPNSRPRKGEALEVLRLRATPGEIEADGFAVYAARDVELAAEPRVVAQGWLAKAAKVEDVLFHPVEYPGKQPRKRYLRYPVFIRPPRVHRVPAGTSRLYWVTVDVPRDAAPGKYPGTIRIGGRRLPLEVEVLPFRLTERGLPRFGAFLSSAPFARGEFEFMKRYGMDALQWFWNSHPIRIANHGGQPKLDFTEYDAFVKRMQAAGMRGPLVLSLGNGWLGHYEIDLAKAFGLPLIRREMDGARVTLMDMTDARWEALWVEGLRQIFAHAREAGWPELALLINDEPTKHLFIYYPYRYQLVKKHFPDVPVYGVFFQPEKDPGPLLHSCDIVVANRDLERLKELARRFNKRFWTYNNVTADESFGKIRLLYGQIPAYYESEAMFFWCWNYWVGSAWDDFDRGQSDADWVAVYPSVDGVEPVRTLAIEAAREAIDDVRYLQTLLEAAPHLKPEVRRRQAALFAGIELDNRIFSDAEFFKSTRNDDVERLRDFAIENLRRLKPD